jgi:hypothetical protein
LSDCLKQSFYNFLPGDPSLFAVDARRGAIEASFFAGLAILPAMLDNCTAKDANWNASEANSFAAAAILSWSLFGKVFKPAVLDDLAIEEYVELLGNTEQK